MRYIQRLTSAWPETAEEKSRKAEILDSISARIPHAECVNVKASLRYLNEQYNALEQGIRARRRNALLGRD